MKLVLCAIALSAVLATTVNGADDRAQPSYFAPLVAGSGVEIEACYTAILARDGVDSSTCNSTLWQIWFAQKKANVDPLDFRDKAMFRGIVTQLVRARNEERLDQGSLPYTQQVKDNMKRVVNVARGELKDDRVSQCLAEIRYKDDSSSVYCDYTLALLNLDLYGLTEVPRIKMRREDLAAVLEQALPAR
ncbi:hypothetical protein [Rhizobium leguminosarum]|uniref:hypothetical protein n=1 Tax=Rhizobium leguminosarum TaxID=384 RepID=UPI001039ED63|nr:hypothetical protein [Rhizobium leguminosarum]TCA59130.1 hypothetical protein E0H41_22950 [Rhizobium leguminosarum bv. viciae]TCB23302.1 hypothetical protein E0J09_23195 [Rhizobium leguminosarum bv. viciae]